MGKKCKGSAGVLKAHWTALICHKLRDSELGVTVLCLCVTIQLSPTPNYTAQWQRQQDVRNLSRAFVNVNTSPMPCQFAASSPRFAQQIALNCSHLPVLPCAGSGVVRVEEEEEDFA